MAPRRGPLSISLDGRSGDSPRPGLCAQGSSDNPDVRISGNAWVDDVTLVPQSWSLASMRLFRLAVFALLAFSVLAYGCVEEWSQAVLEICLAWLLVLWASAIPAAFRTSCALASVRALATLALLVLRRWHSYHVVPLSHARGAAAPGGLPDLLLLLTQAFYRSSIYAGWSGF